MNIIFIRSVIIDANINSQYEAINFLQWIRLYEGFKECGIYVDIFDSGKALRDIFYEKYILVVNIQGIVDEKKLNELRISLMINRSLPYRYITVVRI